MMRHGAYVLLAAQLLGVFCAAYAPTSCGQTPSGWLIHDLTRPRPPVVQPAPQALPMPAPSDARVLFDGSDLSQWRSADGSSPQWIIRDGYMESVPDSGYLFTADGFGDLQLHVEWASPVPPAGTGQERGNSGVFLMGKYEIQVLDSFQSDTYADGQAAAIYGQHPPLANACLPPGEWQSFDIVFRRPRFSHQGKLLQPAMISMMHNGVLVHDRSEVWGPTSWLQHFPYEAHADRLPLALQDHGNPVRYRNIWLRELPEVPTPGEAKPREYVQLPSEDIDRLAGSYVMDDGTAVQITRQENQLWLQVRDRVPLELVPQNEDTFLLRWTAGRLDFQFESTGRADGLVLHLGGRTYGATRR